MKHIATHTFKDGSQLHLDYSEAMKVYAVNDTRRKLDSIWKQGMTEEEARENFKIYIAHYHTES